MAELIPILSPTSLLADTPSELRLELQVQLARVRELLDGNSQLRHEPTMPVLRAAFRQKTYFCSS